MPVAPSLYCTEMVKKNERRKKKEEKEISGDFL